MQFTPLGLSLHFLLLMFFFSFLLELLRKFEYFTVKYSIRLSLFQIFYAFVYFKETHLTNDKIEQ